MVDINLDPSPVRGRIVGVRQDAANQWWLTLDTGTATVEVVVEAGSVALALEGRTVTVERNGILTIEA